MGHLRLVVYLVSAVAGCSGDLEEFSCDDPKYDNGVCDLDTTCGAPDIDCFVTFKTSEEAAAWYGALPGALDQRGPALSSGDPRFAETQALIDDGWEAYKSLHTLGDLVNERPQLVLVQNTAVNAFVAGDMSGISAPEQTRAGFAIMVNTGLVDLDVPREQVLAIMMHEFEHAGGLHVNPAVKTATRKFYKTPADSELLGYQQAEDPQVLAFGMQWASYVTFAGYASDMELGGLPLMSMQTTSSQIDKFGLLGAYFHKLISARVTTVNTVACTNAAQTFVNTSLQVVGSISPLDQNLSIIAGASTTFGNQLVAMRDACFMGVTGDAITHLATVSGRSEASLRAAMPVEMRTVIEAQTVITGWFNAVLEGRKKLREIEASFQTMTGVPWGRLRYFTTEEAADDSAARTMVELGMTPEGGSLLLINDNAALASVCTPMLAGTTQVPYGQHLQDEHHATCWRAKHQAQIGADTSGRKIDWSPIDVSIFGPLPDAPVFMD